MTQRMKLDELILHVWQATLQLRTPPPGFEATAARPPKPGLDTALAIIDVWFGILQDGLMKRWFSLQHRAIIRGAGAAVERWLFCNDLKTRRSNAPVQMLWAAANCVCSAAWLMTARHTRCARRVGATLADEHRALFWAPPGLWATLARDRRRRIVADFIDMQRRAITRFPGEDDTACVYGWFGPNFLYIGSAKCQRLGQRGHSGVAYRWLEHALARHKPATVDGGRSRYAQVRKCEIMWPSFMVLRRGPTPMMRTLESLLISGLDPRANARPRQGQFGGTTRPPRTGRRRRRPLQSCRLRTGAPKPAVDTLMLARAMLRPGGRSHSSGTYAVRWDAPPRTQADATIMASSPLWAMTYTAAYHLVQRSGQCGPGPIDVRRKQVWPLLLLWLTMPWAPIDWHDVAHAWGHPAPEACLAMAAGLPRGPLRKQRLSMALDLALRRRRLPQTRGLTLKVPYAGLVRPVRAALRVAFARLHRHDDERRWLETAVRVLPGRAPKHDADCHAGAAARNVRFEDMQAVAMDPDLLRDAIQMRDAVRVPGRWDVQKRQGPHGLAAIVSRAVAQVSTHLFGTSARLARPAKGRTLAHPDVQRTLRDWRRTESTYRAHTEPMHVGDGCVGVGDDKGRARGWMLPQHVFITALYMYVVNSPFWCGAPDVVWESLPNTVQTKHDVRMWSE